MKKTLALVICAITAHAANADVENHPYTISTESARNVTVNFQFDDFYDCDGDIYDITTDINPIGTTVVKRPFGSAGYHWYAAGTVDDDYLVKEKVFKINCSGVDYRFRVPRPPLITNFDADVVPSSTNANATEVTLSGWVGFNGADAGRCKARMTTGSRDDGTFHKFRITEKDLPGGGSDLAKAYKSKVKHSKLVDDTMRAFIRCTSQGGVTTEEVRIDFTYDVNNPYVVTKLPTYYD